MNGKSPFSTIGTVTLGLLAILCCVGPLLLAGAAMGNALTFVHSPRFIALAVIAIVVAAVSAGSLS